MRFLYHIFGIIYFAIWSVVGVMVIFGIVEFTKMKPLEMLSAITGNKTVQNAGSVLSNTGNIGDVLQKIQSKKGDIPAAFNSLSKDQQTCLKTELGEATINQALAGTLNLTPDLVLKAMKCVK